MGDPSGEVGRSSGSVQARAERTQRVALTGVFTGALIAAGMALLLPALVALDPAADRLAGLVALGLGGAVAVATAAFGPSGEPLGPRLGARVGFAVLATSVLALAGLAIAGLALAPLVDGRVDRIDIAALTLGGFGLALTGSIVAALAVGGSLRAGHLPSAGVPLRWLVGGAAGVVTAGTWAFATAYLVGHLHASARQSAVEEARDLAQLLATLGVADSDKRAGDLTPPGGFIVRLGPTDEIVAGSAVGVAAGDPIEVREGPPTLCRVGRGARRMLPCAERRLPDGTRALAGVTDVPVPLAPIVLFACVGLACSLLALVGGVALGRAPAHEIMRVAGVLDHLGQLGEPGHVETGTGTGLDEPIVAVSLDEIGDLAVALDRLRLHLRPSLLEHDAALERARAANDERDRLLALVSDELRAPLDRILDDSRRLLDDPTRPLTDSQREDIRLIVSSATHLTSLIEEVLDLSAIATGQVHLQLGDLDLGAMLTDVARAQRPLTAPRGVTMSVELPDGSLRLHADERRLRQVVTNLVSNAVKFTSAGSITLSAKRDGDQIQLAVRDTGSGMDPSQLPRLFTEFVQLGTLRERSRGTGLGLAICKRIIEAHGGVIFADSELGKGTTFTVRLPADRRESTPASRRSA